MKKTIFLVILSLYVSYMSAQSYPPGSTEIYQDECFILNTNFDRPINYEYYASDSIILDANFYRQYSQNGYPRKMSLFVDGLGVYPPNHGQQGGAHESDTGYVGALGGTIDVGAMGGAAYSIPIELPTGINGMQPSLAITYNSQGGNGLLGWKWDLAGLSSITRTGKTRYHDGAVGGVNLNDKNDRFLLDGQRLMPVQDYGDSCDYKTEQDDMARIRAYKIRKVYNVNGQTFVFEHIDNFKVWNTDGNILEYGFTEDSRIDPQDGTETALCWLLNKITDRNGNAITYHYEELQAAGQFYISSIEYTENTKLSIKPEFTILFDYEKKSDFEFGYVAGNLVAHKKLLTSITVKKKNDIELLTYSFTYTETFNLAAKSYFADKMYHRLTDITLQKSGMSLNPTHIVWEYDENPSYIDYQMFDLDTTNFNNFIFVGDFNADGFSDVLTVPYKEGDVYSGPIDMNVLINTGNANFVYSQSLSMNHSNGNPTDATLDWVHVLDFNDDGYDDLILQFYNPNPNHPGHDFSSLMVYINQNGQGFLPAWDDIFVIPFYRFYLTIGDFFGEGKQSAVGFLSYRDEHTPLMFPLFYLHYENGACTIEGIHDNTSYRANDLVSGDFDGDGKTEIVIVSQNNGWMYDLRRNNGEVWFHTIRECPEIIYVPELNLFPGDYNGDGKDDLLCYGKNPNIAQERSWFFLFSTGTNFKPLNTGIFRSINLAPSEKQYTYSLEEVNEYSSFAMIASDFDGDGLCDIAVSRNYGTDYISLNIYSKFVLSKLRYIDEHNYTIEDNSYNPLACAVLTGINTRSQYLHIGNFFGKDNTSFLGNEVQSKAQRRKPKLCTLYSLHEYNSVTRIIDGLGNGQRLSYDYITQPGIPKTHIGNGIFTANAPVRTLHSTTAYRVNTPITTYYTFENPTIHEDGHGYLGFLCQETISKINGENVAKQISTFEVATMGSYAFSLPQETTTYAMKNGNWLTASQTEYEFRNVVSSRNPFVVKPAMTRQSTTHFNIDNPNGPNECLSKEIIEYDYSIGSNSTYYNAYNCTETRTGVDAHNVDNYNQCEFKTVESIDFYQDIYTSWTINRPLKKLSIRKRTGKPDVNHSWWYEYTSPHTYQLKRIFDIPSLSNQDPLMTMIDFEYYEDGNLKKQALAAPEGELGEKVKTKDYAYGPGEGAENQHRLVMTEIAKSDDLVYETRYTYDNYDRVKTETGSNGLVTQYEGDALGIAAKAINPDGTQTASALRWVEDDDTYAPQGATYLRWERSSGSDKTLVYYHKSGAELRSVSFGLNGEAIFIDRAYDNMGRLLSVTNPYMENETPQLTVYHYDNLDRPTETSTPDGTNSVITYLGHQTRTTVTPTEGVPQTSTITTNAVGWTVRSDDASGNSFVTYDHYADGLLATAMVNGDATTTISATYDNARNRITLTDPNYGTLTTTYNAYGELRKRVSPKESAAQQETVYQYDGMGRILREINGMENTYTHYIYDENEGALKGTLKQLHHRTPDNQPIQYLYYEYDDLARLTKTIEQRPSGTYETRTAYDDLSRPIQTTYPTGVTVNFGYSHGYLQSIFDNKYNLLWKTDKANAYGQLVDATLGNGSATHRAYDDEMHYLDSIVTTNNLQNLSYEYDKFGNLARRKDNLRNLEETFHYDKMNRLTDIYNGTLHSQIVYDPLGRMTDKQADGQTVFSNAGFDAVSGQPVRPHAMKNAETAEGVFPSAAQEITYTSFDKVKAIAEGDNGIIYTYGYDQQRIHLTEFIGSSTRLKEYVGVCEFITDINSARDSFHSLTYLVGPYGVFAVVEKQGNAENIHYILKDHLGSWTTITDAEGNVEQELSFDAWGNLRDPDTWLNYSVANPAETPMFDRGYTGHEHMTTFDLINMNGRCYDPVTSSFLSVDAYVQDPTNAQAFNRYAYCAYNPLKYTDPTGWLHNGSNPNTLNPNHNTCGSTTWHSDDPCEMLWGRSVIPCKDGDPNRIIITSSGCVIGNAIITNINGPTSQLQAIINYMKNPCESTARVLQEMNIDLTAGCICGSYQDMEGFRSSSYNWTDASGQSYHANVFEYIGGNFNGHYITGNEPAENFNKDNLNILGRMTTMFGLYTNLESVDQYSEFLGRWRDKNGVKQPFHFNGNKFTGGKLKYAKAISTRFAKANIGLNGLGMAITAIEFSRAETTDDKIKYGADFVIECIGMAPGGTIISTFWFVFGGRELVFHYGETMGKLIKDGINPGYPVYQPFK